MHIKYLSHSPAAVMPMPNSETISVICLCTEICTILSFGQIFDYNLTLFPVVYIAKELITIFVAELTEL